MEDHWGWLWFKSGWSLPFSFFFFFQKNKRKEAFSASKLIAIISVYREKEVIVQVLMLLLICMCWTLLMSFTPNATFGYVARKIILYYLHPCFYGVYIVVMLPTWGKCLRLLGWLMYWCCCLCLLLIWWIHCLKECYIIYLIPKSQPNYNSKYFWWFAYALSWTWKQCFYMIGPMAYEISKIGFFLSVWGSCCRAVYLDVI